MKVLVWVLPLCTMLHIFEEFVFPGGFMLWYQKYKPAIASSIKPGFLIIVNVLLLSVCANPINLVLTYRGAIWWLCIVSILAVNAYFHIKGTIESKTYSPGIITGILLYIPLTIYGNWYFISTYKISWVTAILCFLPGVGYHLFSAFNHQRRANQQQGNN